MIGWMVEWRSGPNNVDQKEWRHFVFFDWRQRRGERGNHNLMIFPTRRQARAFAKERYGYIRARRDLRKYPHNWHSPRVVRVTLEVKEIPHDRKHTTSIGPAEGGGC
jgi:hypothetical protein